ncbi:serine/threonine protein kinase [Mycobacterium sp. 1164966.3]|uniref:serine/threonine-protein kinase PknD n=1 Tax=Mycobacterium sp. 1164966.3 TaxID=1856861 RepID=UPI0007FDA9B3|nr:serine/threonine-protein kinase PknD [Mycobacterium sp. 1164966.3]OBA83641.1 serine/threonine protein kinase [Mycobacterium sp. 1164966.3]
MSNAVSREGSQFGPYKLVRLIGRGGMGEVYEAEDTRKRRVVALKLISAQYSDNSVFRARMQREADTAGRLTEPHIVPIHDYGEIDGQFYVEMRLIDGVSLRHILTQTGPMAPARSVAIIRQIAAALDAAHSAGVTHRDVKPENILVTNQDFAYLVDFGIARAATDPGLTQTGTAVGTYNYMAPERFGDTEVTYRADIYALACVLDECLTGSPPYSAKSVERLIASHLMEPAPRPSQLRPGRVPAALDDVIAKGMAKNPLDRYLSCGDLADAAHDALTTSEQRQEATILRQGDNETLMAPVVDPSVGWASFGGSGAHPQQASGAYQQQPSGGYPQQISGGYPQQTSGGYPQQTSGGYPQQSSGPHYASGDYPAATAMGPTPQYPSGDQTMMGPSYPSGDQTMMRPVSGDSGGQAGDQRTQAHPVAGGGWPSQPDVATPGPYTPPGQSYQPAGKPRDKKKLLLIAGGIAAVLLAIVLVAVFAFGGSDNKSGQPEAKPGQQQELPFKDLNFRLSPGGVAVDSSGTVYVTNQGMKGRVVTLAAGSSAPTVKPFSGLYEPQGVAVDSAGKIYVSDFNNRVVSLGAGSNNQTDMPFTGLNYPEGLAVDAQGSIYVADRGNNRVVKLEPGSTNQIVLAFDGLKNPDGVAVDSNGNVYVTDTDNNRVLKLDAGTSNQSVLPFTGLSSPWGIAVDKVGSVYVTEHDNNRVLKLAAGASNSTELPFQGLNTPLSVAVDKDGNVYVADRGNGRVLKLKP